MDIDGVDVDDGAVASGGWRRPHGPTMVSVHGGMTSLANLGPSAVSGFRPPQFEPFPLPAFPTASSVPVSGPPPMTTPRPMLPLPQPNQQQQQQQYLLPKQFFAPSHWTPAAFQARQPRPPATKQTRQPVEQAAIVPAKEATPVVVAPAQDAAEVSRPVGGPVVEPSQPPVASTPSEEEPTPEAKAELPPTSEPSPTSEPAPSPPAKVPTPPVNAVPTNVHEIMVRAKELRLKTARQPAKKLYESRASGMRPLDVALAEARIITENVYVQRKRRKWEEDEVPICSCKPPEEDDQRGCQEDCVNRAALIECLAGFCPCGDRCDNQRIQRGIMPVAEVIDAGSKGLGIQAGQFIKQGDFVGEYMGEIVTEQEYHLRRLRYHNEKHRYMMVLSGGEVIDATRMGGLARFINHSCEPNCGVEKWEVNGEERCAIFALRDINSGEELTFDYKFQSFSALEITACLCGATNCRGIIGANNRAAKQPRKGHASHTALPADQNKSLDPITKKARSTRKTLEIALERMYRALAGTRLFTRKEIAMVLDSRLLLKRNLTRHLDDNLRFLCLEPYFVSDTDGEFGDMQAVLSIRGLPDFPARPEILPKAARQARLEVVLERLRTRR